MTTGEPPPPPPENGPRADDAITAAAGHDGAGRPAAMDIGRVRELRTTIEQLAAQLAAITTQLTETGRLHADLAAAVSEDLAPRVDVLQKLTNAQFGRLRREVDVLLSERRQREKVKNPPINWASLTAAQAAAQWPILARWIGEVLVPRYDLTRDELPDCWALHPAIVAELSWLRTAYVAAYLTRAAPSLAADWHTRWRPAVLARIRELINPEECLPGRHAPRRGKPLQVPAQVAPLSRTHLAEPSCWWPFYERAYKLDLAWRRSRAADGELDWSPATADP